MLSRPDSGWTTFGLGQKERYDLSFLTDVAADWLTQAIHGLESGDVFSVHGFCEPGRMICTVSYWSCYVIFEDDGPAPGCEGVNHLHVNMLAFCKQLHADISRDLDAWVHWIDDDLPEDDEAGSAALLGERRRMLTGKLEKLEALIRENEEYFEAEGGFF